MTERKIELCGIRQLSDPDIHSLRYLIEHLHTPRIIEIGCWAGHSTVHLGLFAKQLGGHVWTIDTFDGTGSVLNELTENPHAALLRNLKVFDLEDTVTVLKGRSDDMVEHVPSDCNMLFIDGDHRYSQVKRDIVNYSAKIVDGIICGHDFNDYEYDEAYIEEDFVSGKHHGVIKAVLETYPNVSRLWDTIWFGTKNVK